MAFETYFSMKPTRFPRVRVGRASRLGLAAALIVPMAAHAAQEALEGIATVPRAKPGSEQAGAAVVAPETALDAVAMMGGHAPIPTRKPEITGAVAYADPTPAPAYAYTAPVPTRAPLESEDEDAADSSGISAPDSTGSIDNLKAALAAIDKRNISTAMSIRGRMQPSLDRRIVDWQLIVSGDPLVSSAFITEFAREAPHWPNAKLMRRRAEVAFYREKPSPDATISAYRSAGPITVIGKLDYAEALLERNQREAAAKIVREIWHTEVLADSDERWLLRDFGNLLRTADHDRRVEMLLYKERANEALALSKKLGSAEQAYVKARVAVMRRAKNQKAAMDSVPRSQRSRAGYIFARIQMLRRLDDEKAAVALMLKAPTNREQLVDPDEWWVERRLQSRNALDLGDAKAAYTIAANHAAVAPAKYAEAEFHAGWFALRFLNDARRAEPHFQNIARIATTPITSSRAYYWIGRAADARGDSAGAKAAFRRAAVYGTTYYGQLARARLGMAQAAVERAPEPTAADRAAFDRNELVRAIRRLKAAGQIDETTLLFRTLALTLPTPGQVALAVDLAETRSHQLALMVGKLAAGRNNDAAPLAFPTSAIPRTATISKTVEKPVVYAIARQESAFNPGAVSHAGALGLLQLMPATAKSTARKAGLKYSKSALTTDPAYNATLGAAHLGELIEKFDGSYIMTFAAYNAGSSRVYDWIERFGDPRSPDVDPIDWVERIPFTETRNYVQRITENLQVYRARLSGSGLNIAADLSRGKPR